MKRIILLSFIGTALTTLLCQAHNSTPGKVVAESGIAVFRDESLNDDNLVRCMIFQSYIDRRAESSRNNGYLSFRNNGHSENVFCDKLVDVILTKEINPWNLENDNDLKQYLILRSRIVSLTKINKVVEDNLVGTLNIMDAYIDKYKGNNILQCGKWLSKEEVKNSQDKQVEEDKINCLDKEIRRMIDNMKDYEMAAETRNKIEKLKNLEIRFSENNPGRDSLVKDLLVSEGYAEQDLQLRIEEQNKKKIEFEKQRKIQEDNNKLQVILLKNEIELREKKEADFKKQKEEEWKLKSLGL